MLNSINKLTSRVSQRFDRISEKKFPYVLTAPIVVLFLIGGVLPIIYSFVISFFDYKLNVSSGMHFIGLENYIAMFQDEVFLSSLWKTLYYSVGVVVLTTIIGLGVALLVRRDFFGKPLFMIFMLIPWCIPKAVNGLMWKWILDPSSGIFTIILRQLGIISQDVYWFNISPVVSISFVILADVWKNIPFVAILMLSALQMVPKTLHEAAICDGAGAIKRFFYITLPSIRYVLIVVVMLQSIWALKVFDLLYTLTPLGGTDNMTTLTYMYVYKTAFNFLNMGYASAIAYFVMLITLVLSVFYARMLRKASQ